MWVGRQILVELPESNFMETAFTDYQIGSGAQAVRGSDARTEERTDWMIACLSDNENFMVCLRNENPIK
jgi:hypothetical protein